MQDLGGFRVSDLVQVHRVDAVIIAEHALVRTSRLAAIVPGVWDGYVDLAESVADLVQGTGRSTGVQGLAADTGTQVAYIAGALTCAGLHRTGLRTEVQVRTQMNGAVLSFQSAGPRGSAH